MLCLFNAGSIKSFNPIEKALEQHDFIVAVTYKGAIRIEFMRECKSTFHVHRYVVIKGTTLNELLALIMNRSGVLKRAF